MQTSTTFNDTAANDYILYEDKNYKVAWSAIIAGTIAAAAVSLILLSLGSSLGLASISPWSDSYDSGRAVETFTMTAAIWLIVMQAISSGLGGYFAGRLRNKSLSHHADEVYFRDTVHGFLTWALAMVITAGFLAAAASSAVNAGFQATTMVAAGTAVGAGYGAMENATDGAGDVTGSFVDRLFYSPTAPTSGSDMRGAAGRILMTGMKDGSITDTDKAYLTQLVSNRTGLSQGESFRRVEDVMGKIAATKQQAKQAMEEARKTATHVAVYTFLSMLVGAFVASIAATCGGKHRDEILVE